MTTKIVNHEGVEMSSEEAIVSLMQRLRRAEALIDANTDMTDILLERIGYLESDHNDWKIV